MVRRTNWQAIRDAIAQDIHAGMLEPGARLPAESKLCESYGAGRHSVRRAIAELAKDGHLSVEQGRGTFVLPRPRIDYAIGRRTRLHRNLTAQGFEVTSLLIGTEDMPAPEAVATALGLSDGAPVVVTRRLTMADGVPVAVAALYHDGLRFPDFAERRERLGSVTATYESYGIADYMRAKTEISARPARAEDAQRLRQHPDMPVMVLHATDVTPDGAPLSHSEVVWSAARVQFSFELGEPGEP